jgi:hypothetical protein
MPPPVNTAPPIVVTPLAQTDKRSTGLVAPGFVRVPGIGYVHKSVFLLVSGALGYMAFRRIKGKR